MSTLNTSGVPNSFFGHTIRATQKQLELLLGFDHNASKDEKSRCIWHKTIDDMPFCVYDWKTEAEPDGTIDWHIGARNEEESKKIYEILQIFLNNDKKNS